MTPESMTPEDPKPETKEVKARPREFQDILDLTTKDLTDAKEETKEQFLKELREKITAYKNAKRVATEWTEFDTLIDRHLEGINLADVKNFEKAQSQLNTLATEANMRDRPGTSTDKQSTNLAAKINGGIGKMVNSFLGKKGIAELANKLGMETEDFRFMVVSFFRAIVGRTLAAFQGVPLFQDVGRKLNFQTAVEKAEMEKFFLASRSDKDRIVKTWSEWYSYWQAKLISVKTKNAQIRKNPAAGQLEQPPPLPSLLDARDGREPPYVKEMKEAQAKPEAKVEAKKTVDVGGLKFEEGKDDTLVIEKNKPTEITVEKRKLTFGNDKDVVNKFLVDGVAGVLELQAGGFPANSVKVQNTKNNTDAKKVNLVVKAGGLELTITLEALLKAIDEEKDNTKKKVNLLNGKTELAK